MKNKGPERPKRKFVQISMKDEEHARAKAWAKLFNVTIGELVENLIISQERKFEKAHEVLGVQKGFVNETMLYRAVLECKMSDVDELIELIRKETSTTVTAQGLSEATITLPPAKA